MQINATFPFSSIASGPARLWGMPRDPLPGHSGGYPSPGSQLAHGGCVPGAGKPLARGGMLGGAHFGGR